MMACLGEKLHLATIILALGAAPAPAQEAAPTAPRRATDAERDALLTAWGEKFRQVKSLEIKFRQEKRLKILRAPRLSEGELAYQDGKLRVTVRGKDGVVESEILLQGGELKIHYPRLERLEVVEVAGAQGGNGPGSGIPLFAMDPGDLGKTYEVSLERQPGADRLILVPRDPKSPVRRVELVLIDLEVREYVQVDASGDQVRMEMLSARLNGQIEPARFELKLAPGTREVRLTGGSKPTADQQRETKE